MITLLWPGVSTLIDSLELDATERETHARTSDITAHPVETGADVNDHIRPKPETVTIDGIITNTPNRSAPDGGRSHAAFAALEDIWRRGRVISVRTEMKTYTSMVLTSLSVPRDAKTGAAVMFSASFQKFAFVSNATSEVSIAQPGQPKSKLGPQAPRVMTAEDVKALTRGFNERGSMAWDIKQGITN